MDEEILLCVYSKDSRRHAMLADDGVTGILYLHAPSDDAEETGDVEATCFAYNRIEPIDNEDVDQYLPGPPPIAKDYASRNAVCRDPESHEWRLKFSADGAAVVLSRDGQPWAIAAACFGGAALLVLLLNLTFDFESSAHAHTSCSTHLWSIRERYGSLLSDLREGAVDLQEARFRRDQLLDELRAMYERTAVTPLGEFEPPQPQQQTANAA